MKLDLKKILNIRKAWKRIGANIVATIKRDAEKGILQGAIEKDQYRSRTYKRYKSQGMKRLDGKNLQSVRGRSTDSYVSSVTMKLTGDLLNGLRVIKTEPYGVTLSYMAKDRMKIIGNEIYGRNIRTLRDDNIEMVRKQLIREFKKNVKTELPKNITINA